jgi:hypothetical protein
VRVCPKRGISGHAAVRRTAVRSARFVESGKFFRRCALRPGTDARTAPFTTLQHPPIGARGSNLSPSPFGARSSVNAAVRTSGSWKERAFESGLAGNAVLAYTRLYEIACYLQDRSLRVSFS